MRELVALYVDTRAADFGPMALKAVRQRMIDKRWCRNTINGMVSRIVRAFKWAAEEELVPGSVWQDLRSVRGLRKGRSDYHGAKESRPVKPVPEAFIEAIRPHVSRQVWAMVQVQLLTGMRPGEVCLMRGCDLDTTGKNWTYTPREHKTEHHDMERIIDIGPRAQEILRPLLRPDLQAFLFSPEEAEAERQARRREERKTPVQPSQVLRAEQAREHGRALPPGESYTRTTYARVIRRACDAADEAARAKLEGDDHPERIIPRWTPNQLRHTFATRMRQEYGVEVVQAALGHARLTTTQVYAQRNRIKAAEAISKIG